MGSRVKPAGRRAILGLLVAVMFSAPMVVFADLDKAFEAVHQNDYEKAYKLFLEAANGGDAEAQSRCVSAPPVPPMAMWWTGSAPG